MLVSLEALAMAGASNVECALDIDEWEREDLEQYPPPHLLAEDDEDNNGERRFIVGHVHGFSSSQCHFLLNHNMRAHAKEEEGAIFTFTDHREKVDTTMEMRRERMHEVNKNNS
ncbi:hypothetical protein RIF29_08624 [Crotalaria pallida]|uniref:Uncharacterized protein n=1 Tax=Crotalaria pallida TaxID=3830 RepID=A0AAN9FR02_CROPI